MEDFDYIFDGLHLRRIQYDGGRFPGRIIYKRRRPERLIPRTENEKLNHYLLDMMLQTLQPLEKYVEAGFRNGKRTGMHAALWWMNQYALLREGFKNSHILPNLVSISQGNLAIDEDGFQAYYDPGTSEICVTWDASAPTTCERQVSPSDDDRLMVVAQDFWGTLDAYGKVNGAPRSTGSDRFWVKPNGDRGYFVYVAFISADGSLQSNSVCLPNQVYTVA